MPTPKPTPKPTASGILSSAVGEGLGEAAAVATSAPGAENAVGATPRAPATVAVADSPA